MTELQQIDLAIALGVLGLIVSTINRAFDAAQKEKKRLADKWLGQ